MGQLPRVGKPRNGGLLAEILSRARNPCQGLAIRRARTFPFNLETAVGSPKSPQALGAPRKTEKSLITPEVTTTFLFHEAHQYLTGLFGAQLPFLGLPTAT